MNKVYVIIFLFLLTVLGTFYSNVTYSDEETNYYIKYSLQMSIYNPSMNMKYELKAILTTRLYLLENNTIKYTVFIERIESKEIRGNQTTTSTTTPLNENDSNFTINIHYDYEQLYETGFSNGGVLYPVLGTNFYNTALFTKFYNISYRGIEKYKDVSVHVFSYKLNYTIPYIVYNLTILSEGEYYVDTVFLQPLYYHSDTILSNGNINITMSLLLETLETNLPQDGVYGYDKTENIELLAGGFPKADIIVSGSKGSNMINATNNGVEPGYLLIIYRNAPNTMSLASTPIIPQEKYKIIYLPPSTTKNIDLSIVLDKDISFETSKVITVNNNINWLEISGLAIIAIVIVTITYVYYKRKSHIDTHENVEEQVPEETSINEEASE